MRDALAAKGNIDSLIAEIQSGAEVVADYHSEFVRNFAHWSDRFRKELKFMAEDPVGATNIAKFD